MCQPLGQRGWWGPDLKWWWWNGRKRWMVLTPVSIDMLQFTPEISGLKQKRTFYHIMWFLWVELWEGLSQAVYLGRAIIVVVWWWLEPEKQREREPSISVSSCGLRATPRDSSICDSLNFPITWRPFADELQGAWWELNHLLWVSLGSHIVLLSPHYWSIQPEKSSFKRKRHRPTFNGRIVKELLNVF